MLGHVRHNQCREPGSKPKTNTKPESEDEDPKYYCPHKCNAVFRTRFTLNSHVRWRCPKNPACTQRLKQTRMKARAKATAKIKHEEEALDFAETETEPMEHEEDESFTVALEEECTTEVLIPDANTKNETETEEMIVAEEHEIITAENMEEVQVEERYEVIGVENQQCYEVYEVQELPEGVHVQEIHGDELIQTIHYEEYPLSEETQ